jgi:hypothetical protein
VGITEPLEMIRLISWQKRAPQWLLLALPELFLPYAKILCKQETKAILLKRWTAAWQKSIDYRQTKIFFPLPDASVSKNLLRLSRKDLGLIIRHGTGHSNLNYHQSKQQPGLSPLCHLCGEKAEESHHIILSCPALCRTRREWLWQPVQSIAWYTERNKWASGPLIPAHTTYNLLGCICFTHI